MATTHESAEAMKRLIEQMGKKPLPKPLKRKYPDYAYPQGA